VLSTTPLKNGVDMGRSGIDVATVFERAHGPLLLDDNGKWWITRQSTGLDSSGRVTVTVSDGVHVAHVHGTPTQLSRLSEAIAAQVRGAEVNEASHV
jgi:hypothetical protein